MRNVVIFDSIMSQPRFEQILESYADVIRRAPETRFHLMTRPGALDHKTELRSLFQTVWEVPDNITNGNAERELIEFGRRVKIDCLFVPREFHLLRAARIREALNIAGQDVQSAAVYRDKLLMKIRAREHGIPTLDFIAINDFVDLVAVRETWGFPFVVKPRTGGGEIGLELIRDEATYRAFLERVSKSNLYDRPLHLIAEPLSNLQMWHVDGLRRDGKIAFLTASEYVGPYPQFEGPWSQYGVSGSVMADPEDPKTTDAMRIVQRIFEAFPTPSHCTFHIELWHHPERGFILNEAATRTGGFLVYDMFALSGGMNPDAAWLAAEVGVDLRPEHQGCTRSVRVPWREGVVKKVPQNLELPFLHSYELRVNPGETLGPWESWSQSLAQAVILGESKSVCDSHLREFLSIFERESVIG